MRTLALPLRLLCGWTLFVWGLRSRNLTDDSVEVGAAEVLPIVGFVLIGIALLLVVWRSRDRLLQTIEQQLVTLAAVVTGLYWLIRGVEIFFDDHSAAFIAVHTVLATVSIGLSVWLIMAIRRNDASRWGLASAGE